MRILALVPGGMDEQILFFPTLEDLKQHYPSSTIDVLVEPRAKNAYRVCPSVNEVLMFDYKDRNGLADYLNLLGIIRDREYEVALSAGQRWTVGLLLWLNGIPIRIGYKTSRSWFFSQSVPLKTEQYAAYKYHDLLQGLGIHSSCPELTIAVPKEDIDWAEAEQKRLDLKDTGYILIHEGIEQPYPVSHWGHIIDDIQQKQPNLPIVLLQNPEDGDWVTRITQERQNLKVTTPSDIGKLAAMIAGANLMLSTDNVSMYLATAVGTYTIALLDSTNLVKRLPSGQERYIGIQSSTGQIADIPPITVLEQIWRG